MPCTCGKCETQSAHYKSIRASVNPPTSKTTTDVHEVPGKPGVIQNTVDVRERNDGQDVTVKMAAPVRTASSVSSIGV